MVNKYYQKNKEKLWKEAREKYQNLSEEEKEKNRKKARDRSFWRRKTKKGWIYENLLFSTKKNNFRVL